MSTTPIAPGTPLPVVEHTISQDDINRYAEASGDFNPLHIDEDFARTTPFGGTIAHGLMSVAFLSEMMFAQAGPSWLTTGTLFVKFTNPVRPNDTVRAQGTVTGVESIDTGGQRVRCEVRCTKQDGTDVTVGDASYVKHA